MTVALCVSQEPLFNFTIPNRACIHATSTSEEVQWHMNEAHQWGRGRGIALSLSEESSSRTSPKDFVISLSRQQYAILMRNCYAQIKVGEPWRNFGWSIERRDIGRCAIKNDLRNKWILIVLRSPNIEVDSRSTNINLKLSELQRFICKFYISDFTRRVFFEVRVW